ncbi:MAG: hypothetical protein QW533_06975, partial [Thermoplasmata archaeon]
MRDRDDYRKIFVVRLAIMFILIGISALIGALFNAKNYTINYMPAYMGWIGSFVGLIIGLILLFFIIWVFSWVFRTFSLRITAAPLSFGPLMILPMACLILVDATA